MNLEGTGRTGSGGGIEQTNGQPAPYDMGASRTGIEPISAVAEDSS